VQGDAARKQGLLVPHSSGGPLQSDESAGEHYSPAVAFDGTNYLVVWTDSRPAGYDIYGARVSQAGTVLDPGGFAISTAPASQEVPALAFDGTNFLVTWTDNRSGSGWPDVYGARVSRAGTVLDPDGIPISTASFGQGGTALAFDGTNYLVTWSDSRSGTGSADLYGARVSPAGAVLDPAGFAISTAPNSQQVESLAFDETNFVIAWEDWRSGSPDIYGARVSPAGSVLDPSGIPISTRVAYERLPEVAFDGTNCLVIWSDQHSGGSDIYGARVSGTGTVLDPDGFAISTAPGEQSWPALAFDNTNYLASWDDGRMGPYRVFGARVTPVDQVLDPAGIPISTSPGQAGSSALAFGGTDYIAVWTDDRLGAGHEIFGARLTTSGTVLDPSGFPISVAPPPPPPPPPPPDTQPPHVRALKSGARRGRMARLRYTVWDNRGVTRDTFVVFAGRRAVARGQTEWGPARRGAVYSVRWRVPRRVLKKVRFCVLSEDPSRNKSGVSCAKVVITK
jgi:hypothetical protein